MALEWEEFPTIRSMVLFCAKAADTTYCVSYDTQWPELGWVASARQFKPLRVNMLGTKFKTREDAVEACENDLAIRSSPPV